MSKVKKQKNNEFNDLMIPIIFVIGIMPFIVRLAVYDYGFGGYEWHSENSVITDIYTYFRSYFFEIIAIFAGIILLFRMWLYKQKSKNVKIYVPVFIMIAMTILSTVFSVNVKASVKGNFYQFQSVLVIAGYVIISLYTYQIMTEEYDYKMLFRTLAVMSVPLYVVGICQVAGHDLLDYAWMQKLIMTKSQFEVYGNNVENAFSGNNVYLTFSNPNFAGTFLAMVIMIYLVNIIWGEAGRKRIVNGVLFAVTLLLLWFTYTRGAVVAIVISIIVMIFGRRSMDMKRVLRIMILVTILSAVVLVVFDACNEFHFLSRMIDKGNTSKLESVITADDGVEMKYDDDTYILSVDDSGLIVRDKKQNIIKTEVSKDSENVIPFSNPAYANILNDDEGKIINMFIDDKTIQFIKKADGYYYRNDYGKDVKIKKVKHVDFHGFEYLGSGRLYIWSRVSPMLKDYVIVGSGPDTFAEVYPQEDYIGKFVYSSSARTIIERAHNDYLMTWVQTGMISALSLVVFYILLIRKCFRYYGKCQMSTTQQRMGFGCFLGCVSYMASGMFSDSSLFTTPVFWVFTGVTLSVANLSEKS